MKLIRQVAEVDDKEMAGRKIHSIVYGGDLAFKSKLHDPACSVAVEEFFPGSVSQRHGMWAPELMIMIEGELEVDYMTCSGIGQWEHNKFIARPGDAFLMDAGDQVVFRVPSTTQRNRHLCIHMPPRPYPAPAAPENRP